MTADPWAAVFTDTDRADMDTRATLIGCLWVAAHEHHTHNTVTTWARLQRTRHRARYAGIDEPTIQQTQQLAKETT